MSIDYAVASRTLARRDPVMRDLVRRHGPCGLARAQHQDPYRALVHAIISQQLSTKAAATIGRRVDEVFGGEPTPAAVARVPDERLRAAGMSTQKIR
jgi:DNA-3-methyladenine glycosylase II